MTATPATGRPLPSTTWPANVPPLDKRTSTTEVVWDKIVTEPGAAPAAASRPAIGTVNPTTAVVTAARRVSNQPLRTQALPRVIPQAHATHNTFCRNSKTDIDIVLEES
jgi:hypothetical protein